MWEYYDFIFKRKSIHLSRDIGSITSDEVKSGRRGIMPANKVTYYNRIDIGIFLCFLEICLSHDNVKFERTLYADSCDDSEKVLNAVYHIACA